MAIPESLLLKIDMDTYRHPTGVLPSFSIKNTFCDKMDLRLFYFDVAT